MVAFNHLGQAEKWLRLLSYWEGPSDLIILSQQAVKKRVIWIFDLEKNYPRPRVLGPRFEHTIWAWTSFHSLIGLTY